jgi:hypothetical protein
MRRKTTEEEIKEYEVLHKNPMGNSFTSAGGSSLINKND